ncbi:MAG: MoaD/ThiS family protein [Planctomycetes bacterium]|nr:MoaD/ThiS family protein [Planctomycetota bacterium]
MAVKVNIPTMLRNYSNGQPSVLVEGTTVGEVLQNLDQSCAGIKERLLDKDGRVRRFINIYVDSEDIRLLRDLETPVASAKEIRIMPAIAGGRPGFASPCAVLRSP